MKAAFVRSLLDEGVNYTLRALRLQAAAATSLCRLCRIMIRVLHRTVLHLRRIRLFLGRSVIIREGLRSNSTGLTCLSLQL